MLNPIVEKDLSITNDTKILATAIDYNKQIPIKFITNDMCLKHIAKKIFFPLSQIGSINEEMEDTYTGYIDKIMSNEEMEYFYSNQKLNTLNALVNQYIIIRNEEGKAVDWLVWLGDEYRQVSYDSFESKHFGKIKPLDVY